MIPTLRADGTLPPGVHPAENWNEIAVCFGGTSERQVLLGKLRAGLENLRDAGCEWVWLNGSFVTGKSVPDDVDGCWEWHPKMELTKLDSAFLLRSRADRAALKMRYGMDFFIADMIESGSGLPFSEFFQRERDGGRKGIVWLNLSRL